jgi:DNA repair protein SbcD/Mre11
MRFIHASDLHIDSPLRGLDKYENAPVDMIRSATRDAFQRLVDVALSEKVDFVVLSGDLADGDWKNTQTMLWLNAQFRRLEEKDISVFTIRGNHDAQNKLSESVTLAKNVYEFPKKPFTFKDPNGNYAIHGQSYPSREVLEDIAKDYPKAIKGMFNIGILHTNLVGSSEHSNYAPTTVDELKSKGYDYWALGHVHNRALIHKSPYIVYPGNTQGRNIRETGEKGCYLVTVEDGRITGFVFISLQVVIWETLTIESLPEDTILDVMEKVKSGLNSICSKSSDMLTVVRVRLHGPNTQHKRLESPNELEDLKNKIRDLANSSCNPLWVEKIHVELTAPIDMQLLKKSDTLLGDLLRLVDEFAKNPDALKSSISNDIAAFKEKAALEIERTGKNIDDIDVLRDYLKRAESILISHISGVSK